MKILSLFDGMACGMLAMMESGVAVDRYIAYEIDKYATKTASHNFPMIEQRGDVFQADFTEFRGFDYIVGGSPCTYWSIAQKNGRETEASGLGWELFSQYARAVREAQPRFFIYENNKSMSNAIRESIMQTFGFEPICINSARVSAQNRQRLYWVGKRNTDGTYSKVDVQQPEDLGVMLRDILDGGIHLNPTASEKSRVVDAHMGKLESNLIPRMNHQNPAKQQYDCIAEPVDAAGVGEIGGKGYALTATYGKATVDNTIARHQRTKVAEPICVAERGRYVDGIVKQHYEARTDGKTNTLTTVQKDNNVAEPVRVGSMLTTDGRLNTSQSGRIYSIEGKGVCLNAGGGGGGARTGLYAIPVEFDGEIPTKAKSGADGKIYPVYEVRDGKITIKDRQYDIKLPDGYYIIRKLTLRECKRLQTVPEWYEFPVSDAQAYKMLGNGWTVKVISHLIEATVAETTEPETEITDPSDTPEGMKNEIIQNAEQPETDIQTKPAQKVRVRVKVRRRQR